MEEGNLPRKFLQSIPNGTRNVEHGNKGGADHLCGKKQQAECDFRMRSRWTLIVKTIGDEEKRQNIWGVRNSWTDEIMDEKIRKERRTWGYEDYREMY
jgi:hypothetical protein